MKENNVQSVRNAIVLRLLKTLEYQEGDIISYDDLLRRLHIWCYLSRSNVESCVGHNFHLIMDSDIVRNYFRIQGESKKTKILEGFASGKSARDMEVHNIELQHILRKFLKGILKNE